MVEPLMNIQQARKMLGIGDSTMRALVKNQEISFVILGHRKLMFTEQAIKDYLASRTVKAKPIVLPNQEAHQ